MTERFFGKYPKIFYEGLQAVDLTRRVKIATTIRGNPNLFYPLTLTAGLRADSLADAYYGDSELDWLIYHSNEVVDPYYDWYLDEIEFRDYVAKKYGSVEFAIKKTKFWRTNWHGSPQLDVPSGLFADGIADDDKQYYQPTFGNKADILWYQRREEDWLVATNKILEYAVTYTSGNAFSNGEILDIKFSGEVVGGAEVVVSNSTALIINHTTGNTHANTGVVKTLVGETSNTTATANAVTTLQEVITNADGRFWSSVSFFDWENEMNESRKNLHILDARYELETVEQFRLKLIEE